MNPDLIAASGVSFLYPNKRGIRDITFSVSEGEILCIFGKNGSGKTTLMKVLSTLYKPQQGALLVCGYDAVKKREMARQKFFCVFDENAHFEFASGRENILFFMDIYGSRAYDTIDELADLFELDLDLPAGQYSYGMKRKLYLMEAFASNKEILLFDEPTLGLDSETRDRFFSLIKDRGTENKGTVIYGTNKVEEARHADRIVFIHEDGLQETTMAALLEKLITVDIYMEKEKITDYIGGIEELPELVKKYIRFGIPRKIEITSTLRELTWTEDAVRKVERAPAFVRGMIFKVVEKHAREKGYTLITPEVVEEAQRRFEPR